MAVSSEDGSDSECEDICPDGHLPGFLSSDYFVDLQKVGRGVGAASSWKLRGEGKFHTSYGEVKQGASMEWGAEGDRRRS